MDKPIISIIIPVKDRLKLLRETLDSVKSQTSKQWQVIIVDDGSSDETKNFLTELVKSDSRFIFIERENTDYTGPTVCRNLGVYASKAKYVIFLDSDDLLASTAIEKRVSIMERNTDLDFALFATRVFYDDTTETFPWLDEWNGLSDLDRLLKMEWPMNVTSPIWNRNYIIEKGLFDESLPSWDDWEFHTRVLMDNPKYLRFQNEIDFFIRATPNQERLSSIQFRDSSHLESASNVFCKVTNLLKAKRLLTKVRSEYLMEQFFGTAYLSLKTDGLRAAIKRLKKSKALIPELSRKIYILSLLRLIYSAMKKPFLIEVEKDNGVTLK